MNIKELLGEIDYSKMSSEEREKGLMASLALFGSAIQRLGYNMGMNPAGTIVVVDSNTHKEINILELFKKTCDEISEDMFENSIVGSKDIPSGKGGPVC